jgi:hypothetical protein
LPIFHHPIPFLVPWIHTFTSMHNFFTYSSIYWKIPMKFSFTLLPYYLSIFAHISLTSAHILLLFSTSVFMKKWINYAGINLNRNSRQTGNRVDVAAYQTVGLFLHPYETLNEKQ